MDENEIFKPLQSTNKMQTFNNKQDDWKRVFNGVIVLSKLSDHHTWCLCVHTTWLSQLQEFRAFICTWTTQLTTFFKLKKKQMPDSTTSSVAMFAYFIADHSDRQDAGKIPLWLWSAEGPGSDGPHEKSKPYIHTT